MGGTRIGSLGCHALLAVSLLLTALPAGASEPDEPSGLAVGKLLVAGRHMRDPHFSETVVLLIRYGPDGALGLVVNRPTDVRLSMVFPEIDGLDKNDDQLYEGGPVSPDSLLMLVHSRKKKQPEDSTEVLEGVFISRSNELLERMLKDSGRSKGSKRSRRKQGFRIYAGYAGWAPGQLDSELARGDWHIVKADADTVFDDGASETWKLLLPRDPRKWAFLPGVTAEENQARGPLASLAFFSSRSGR